jgi:hypothetical protein
MHAGDVGCRRRIHFSTVADSQQTTDHIFNRKKQPVPKMTDLLWSYWN